MTRIVSSLFALTLTLALAGVALACGENKSTMADQWSTVEPAVQQTAWVEVRSLEQYQRALAKAPGDRPVLVGFHDDNCGSCATVKTFAWNDPAVTPRVASDFYAILVNVTDKPTDLMRLAEVYAVRGAPALRVMTPAGQERDDLRLDGSYSAERFVTALDQATAERVASLD